ncbi:Zn(2)-C6 fungal-type domain-containing protein [Favolaschia claudopus]|uniref:Zn(2)-C6 fungal-type domain-containing protein n=1 Tax=Favolaschia claudopus TaxID=2862362 RepID=A0AAW0CR74_9AGAR
MPKETSGRARRPYTTQACTVCRAKKSKCDGVKPICGFCAASGRAGECLWGRDVNAKKPRTEAHFEALTKRAEALQAYIERLEKMLSKCVCQTIPQSLEEHDVEEEVASNSDVQDSDDEITKLLTIPVQRLKLDDRIGNVVLHDVPSMTFGNKIFSEAPRLPEEIVNSAATYVLQLEDVDVSQTHPEIEWSRHLPPQVTLSRREHDEILHRSFSFFTMFTLRVVPSLFLRDMYRALSVPRSEKPPRTSFYSPMLHNAILAMATLFSDNPYLKERKTRQHFVNTAKFLANAEYWKPDVSLVQAFAFLASFYADYGERIQAELFAGQSSRLSVTLGLGIDATPLVKAGHMSDEERVGRNRTYWTTFGLDITFALYFGREYVGSYHQNIPPPSADTELDKTLWHHPNGTIAPQPNNDTLLFSHSCGLFVIACGIMNNLPTIDWMLFSKSKSRKLKLNNWKSQLPPQVDMTPANRAKSTPHRLMLHIAYWWCYIGIHRPFFGRRPQPKAQSDRSLDHVKLCTRAAEHVFELVETWRNLYSLRMVPTHLIQIVFHAATISLLRALQATASLRISHGGLGAALAQLETCTNYLDEMRATWNSAALTKDTLVTIMNTRLRPVIARRLAVKGEPTVPKSLSTRDQERPEGPPPDPSTVLPPLPEFQQTAPAPSDTSSQWDLPSLTDLSHLSMDSFVPTPIPVVPAAVDLGAVDMDMTALLTCHDFLGGASEFWQQSIFTDDKTANGMFDISQDLAFSF